MKGNSGDNFVREAGNGHQPAKSRRLNGASPLPHSNDAEKALLGSLLIHGGRDLVDMTAGRLGREAQGFYQPAHQTLFRRMQSFQERGAALDLVTFTQALSDAGELEKVGGAPAVTELFTFVPTATNLPHYLGIVEDKFLLREIIAKCQEAIRRSVELGEAESAESILLEHQEAVTALALLRHRPDSSRHIGEGIEATIDWMQKAYKRRGKEVIDGLALGFFDVDRMIAGVRGGAYVVIAARPSHGKTAIAMNIVEHIAVAQQQPVQVFSLEMSYQELADRMTCAYARINLKKLRTGMFSKEQAANNFTSVVDQLMPLYTAPIYVDDTPSLSITELKVRARAAVTRRGVKAIVIDYLQLMRGSDRYRRSDNRVQEVTEISSEIKALGKELNVPIIVCAQLNREAEKERFARPKLAQLRESGAIEQDCDIALLLWRPIRQAPPSAHKKLAELLKIDEDELESFAELNVAKQRNGPTGEVRLRFEGPLTRFENVTTKMWSNNPAERQQHVEEDDDL